MTTDENVSKTCQKCTKRKDTTRRRTIYLKSYIGPCADSFCYASCTSSSCRPVDVSVCNECSEKMEKKK